LILPTLFILSYYQRSSDGELPPSLGFLGTILQEEVFLVGRLGFEDWQSKPELSDGLVVFQPDFDPAFNFLLAGPGVS
jgi:hypothetical protein